MSLTERLTKAVATALDAAGLPPAPDCAWEVPRQAEHGDYATNAAMTLARAARRLPRQIAEAIVRHFPAMPEVDRLEIAGPGFVNVFLASGWVARALGGILDTGERYGRGDELAGQRVRLEFVSANPTGPLVIVNARAAAIGDSLARLLRARGARVVTEFYVNDAGTQFEALARSFEARVRQAVGESVALPEKGYPGEYLIDLAGEYVQEHKLDGPEALEAHLRMLETEGVGSTGQRATERIGRWAVARMLEGQRRGAGGYRGALAAWAPRQHDRPPQGPPRRLPPPPAPPPPPSGQGGGPW